MATFFDYLRNLPSFMYLSVYKYMEQGKFDKGLVILDGNKILRSIYRKEASSNEPSRKKPSHKNLSRKKPSRKEPLRKELLRKEPSRKEEDVSLPHDASFFLWLFATCLFA